MSRRALPIIVFVVIVAALTIALWMQPPAPEPAPPAGPLAALAPHLARLDPGAEGEINARAFVEATMDAVEGSPREPILEALGSEDPNAQWAGLLAVPRYGTPDATLAQALAALLAAENDRNRWLAAAACGFLGAEFPTAEPALERAARDPAPKVRAEALATLAQSSTRLPTLWTLFRDALADEPSAVRAAGAKGLARIELKDHLTPRYIAPLREALGTAMKDESHDVRMYAVMALGRMGSEAAPEVDGIVALLDDESTLVRGTAANALGELGAAALPAIRAALPDAPPQRVSSLLWALRMIGEPALPALRDALKAEQATTRVQAALKLWELEQPPEPSVDVLASALEGDDADARRLAARGFARMGTAGATARSVLARYRDHEDSVVRDAVRSALARIDAAGRKPQK